VPKVIFKMVYDEKTDKEEFVKLMECCDECAKGVVDIIAKLICPRHWDLFVRPRLLKETEPFNMEYFSAGWLGQFDKIVCEWCHAQPPRRKLRWVGFGITDKEEWERFNEREGETR